MTAWLWLLVVLPLAAVAASLGNAAVYGWAWNHRRVSPWQLPAPGVKPRGWADCVPIFGWLRLRRDESVLGRGFWVRPMLVEAGFIAAMAALCVFEIGRQGLITPQLAVGMQGGPWMGAATPWPFINHVLLAWLMMVASLIDIDEKTIPDEVTLPGTLLGLLLAALMPAGLLPNVGEGSEPPIVAFGVPIDPAVLPPGADLTGWVEPTHLAAPQAWPTWLAGGAGNGWSLALGLACYGLWCFALTPRYLRLRRGVAFGLAIVLRRVVRTLLTRPLREVLLGGVLTITMVWFTGGGAWLGLLTALVGMVVSGAIVWAVRIIGSLALGREAMGFGDVTLMMMVGAFVGWQAGLLAFFLAPFAGLVVGLGQLLLRRDDEIPYGPFLCLATALVVVRWGHLWRSTEGLFALGWIVPVVLLVCLVLLGVLLGVWRVIKERLLGMGQA